MKRLKLIENDSYLAPFEEAITRRHRASLSTAMRLSNGRSLCHFANGYNYYGLHKNKEKGYWVFREWAPAARAIYVIGAFSSWKEHSQYRCTNIGNDNWELKIPLEVLQHKDLYKLVVHWDGGFGERLPAWTQRVVQESVLGVFNAQVWDPGKDYKWEYSHPASDEPPIIYEAHVGMSSQEGKVADFNHFTKNVIPHIKEAGYNTIQLMAVQEHPYYGSFGYHVSNFFAVSSRFGTPEELKELIDTAHKYSIRVIMDIVHSHAVKNEVEGISRFDGTLYQYFHDGPRGLHTAWDSRCFNYGKDEVLHFLLSNCKFWLETYQFDGFRFDGITSMLYHDHGLGANFTNYEQYFNQNQDEDAIVYLTLANMLIHEVNPQALTIAEEMSGMPGLAAPLSDGGIGFDYRLAMGVPDFWIKQIKEVKDEHWHVGDIFYNLRNKRTDEKVISYAESHDQALVGDQTIIFRLIGADMYYGMHKKVGGITVDRGIALHKIIRLLTIACAGDGYLNFMGNEFGHPEWIDFPREGNNWSFHYARRQWHLLHDKDLKYHWLGDFDKNFIQHFRKYQILKYTPNVIVQNTDDQILVFERGGFIFIFSLNPFTSFTNYGFQCPDGKYRIIINSDNAKYGGHGRIDESLIYDSCNTQLKIYIPTQTALVLEKID